MNKKEINNLFLTLNEDGDYDDDGSVCNINYAISCMTEFEIGGVKFTPNMVEYSGTPIAVYTLPDGTNIAWESCTQNSWNTEHLESIRDFCNFKIVKLTTRPVQVWEDEKGNWIGEPERY